MSTLHALLTMVSIIINLHLHKASIFVHGNGQIRVLKTFKLLIIEYSKLENYSFKVHLEQIKMCD